MKRVGILRGGNGNNYTSSLQKGGDLILHILENLNHKYKTSDILVDKEGMWHINGRPTKPADLIHKVDVIWNTSQPGLSIALNNLSIPNIGINSFSSILENNREMLREHLKGIGLLMPKYILFPKSAREVLEKFGAPWKVEDKLVKNFSELAELIENNKNILVEEFIAGKVASIHCVPHFRGQDLYIFPPVNVFGNLSSSEKEKLSLLAKNLHHHLGNKHYLKSNFVMNKRGKVYLLDLEFTPNLKSFSHFSQACESVGAKTCHVIEHILEQV
jgi:D-alanine-D-alanine ligase-like ATP-grasp enzyme